jgi:glutaminyl-tRNA synthetase
MSEKKGLNFIEQIVQDDIESGKHDGRVHTRFPPEPNGYLHIGHAKSIVLNFELAAAHGGLTNLRFDDTNPSKESVEYVDSIKRDVSWLGYDWGDREYYTSDYFQQLYDFAVQLIRQGQAYVDDSSPEEMAEMKGTPTRPGVESPFRERAIEESLELFEGMRDGKYDEGSRVLRAKIDMSSPNMHMRDPILYRIKKENHHRTADAWCIYPMYDFAHGQSDSIEKITHSLCTVEFENHRPLYNWFIEKLGIFPSRQIEFARLNLNYTVLSKRRLLRLVEEGIVASWDDPRMPTISGMRRRGYTPEAIQSFCREIGVAKRDNLISMSLLEYHVREHLNEVAPRVMAVTDPIELVITTYPEDKTEVLSIENNPEQPETGDRSVNFSRSVWIERDDFMEDPPEKFYRLGIGRTVRLKGAYIVECTDFEKDENTGAVTRVYAKHFPESRSGEDDSGIKVKGTIHWVNKGDALDARILGYDRLFNDATPASHDDKDFTEFINPDSLEIIEGAKVERSLHDAKPMDRFQFLRKGYYCVDQSSTPDMLVFNRTVMLRDPWKKVEKQQLNRLKQKQQRERKKKKRNG